MFKLRHKIAFLVLAVSLTCIGAIGVFSYITASRHLADNVKYKYLGQLRLIAENMALSLEPVERNLVFLSNVPPIQGIIRARENSGFDPVGGSSYQQWKRRLQIIFAEFVKAQARYMQIRLIDERGMELVRVDWDGVNARIIPDHELQDKSSRYYFKKTMEKGPKEVFVSRIDLNRERGRIETPYRPAIRFATPVFDADLKRRGIVVINLLDDYFLNIRPMLDLGEDGFVFITDMNGFYLYHSRDPAKRWGSPHDLNTGQSLVKDYPAAAPGILSGRYQRISTGQRVLFARPVTLPGGLKLFSVIDLPKHYANAPLYEFIYFLLYLVAGALALTVVISLLFSRWMLKPIHLLREGARRVSRGDFEHRLEITSRDEIQELAADFNTMVSSLKEKTSRLARLYQIATTSGKDSAEVADMVVSSAAEMLNVNMSCMLSVHQDRVSVLSFYNQGRILRGKELPHVKEPWARILETGEPCQYHGIAQEFPGDPFLRDNRIKSCYGVPVLTSSNEVVGILAAMDTGHIEFSEDDKDLLYTLSKRIAFELEMEAGIRRLRQSNWRLDALYRVASSIGHSIKLDELLNGVLDVISDIDFLNLQKEAAIFLLDKEGKEMVLAAHRGFSEEMVEYEQRIKTGECLCGRVALSGKALVSKNSDDNPDHTRRIPHMEIHGDVCIPLRAVEEVIGVLNMHLEPDTQLPEDDFHVLEMIGNQLGIAIQNAVLFKETKDHAAELERRVEERTRELMALNEDLKRASQAKSDFLSGMSHELRTPLNAIIGFSEVLQEGFFGELNEKQAGYVKDILESGKHLLSLINDILDISKVEAGRMELELSSVRIPDLLEKSLVMIREKANKHRISLDLDVSEDLYNLEIEADERKLKQIMLNLLSNAAKFTPDGGEICVAAELVDGARAGHVQPIGKRFVEISVSDTGIGIEPEDREKIFEEFYQVSSSIRDKSPGTGLGLSLARRLVEMHNGRIWVESDGKGKGSRFVFFLPVKQDKSPVKSL